MKTLFKLLHSIALRSSSDDMLDRTSLKHNDAFKQQCYHSLPLERIFVSFPLSLFLQLET